MEGVDDTRGMSARAHEPVPAPGPSAPMPLASLGPQPPPMPLTGRAARSRRARRFAVIGTMALGFGLCALVTTSWIGVTTGAFAMLVGFLFALVPVAIVVPSFFWIDSYEHEPARRLALAFAYGATVAAAISLVLNTGSMAMLAGMGGTVSDASAETAVGVAPLVEETAKGLGIVLLWSLDRDELDGIVDGMVYAGLVAAGFAFAENILYLGRAYAEAGGAGLVGTFVLRGLVGPFAHPIFTACTGIGIGIAVNTRRRLLRWGAPVLGWCCAALLHAMWNLTAVAGAGGYLAVFFVTQVPVFVAFGAMALWARRAEGRVIMANLARYAQAGWFTAAEVTMVSTLTARQRALAWARATGGPAARRAMEQFQDEATSLALLRRRLDACGPTPADLDRERRLLDAVTRLRPTAMSWASGPSAPTVATTDSTPGSVAWPR